MGGGGRRVGWGGRRGWGGSVREVWGRVLRGRWRNRFRRWGEWWGLCEWVLKKRLGVGLLGKWVSGRVGMRVEGCGRWGR